MATEVTKKEAESKIDELLKASKEFNDLQHERWVLVSNKINIDLDIKVIEGKQRQLLLLMEHLQKMLENFDIVG